MGIMNYAVNRLLERKDIFADLINGTLFEGKEFLHSDNMELLSPNSGKVYKDEIGNLKVKEYNGDVRMRSSEKLYSIIIAMEPQDNVHYAMPIRMMEYVAMEYRKQIQDLQKVHKKEGDPLSGEEYLSGIRKGDKVTPVLTVVLYCSNNKEWDGSKSLYDMMNWGEDQQVEDKLKKYISDFQTNVIEISNFQKLEIFKTSLQYIFGMLKYSKDVELMKTFIEYHRDELKKFDEVEMTAAFALLGHTKQVEKMISNEVDGNQEEGGMDMCKALDDMMMERELLGEKRGEARGIDIINRLVNILIERNRLDDLIRSTNDKKYQKQLLQEFNIITE